MTENPLKGLVCATDTLVREAAAAAVRDGGYELAGATATALDALRLAEMTEPDLVVIDNDLPSRLGIEWIPELHELLPASAIILIANDPTIRDRALQEGAFGVVYKTELSELEGALGRARGWLTDPELHKPFERRTGKDRRQRQDWTKVTTERRRGSDRRHEDLGPPVQGRGDSS